MLQDLIPLTFAAFCDTYGFSGRESVLRITAKRTDSYGATTKTYVPSPLLLDTLANEGQIPKTFSAPSIQDPQQPLPSNKHSSRTISLDDLIQQAVQTCSRDPTLRNTDQPCRGDVQAFLVRQTPSPSLQEQYSRSLIAEFVTYWKNNHRRRTPTPL